MFKFDLQLFGGLFGGDEQHVGLRQENKVRCK